jgi:hypothetical protein
MAVPQCFVTDKSRNHKCGMSIVFLRFFVNVSLTKNKRVLQLTRGQRSVPLPARVSRGFCYA